MWWRREIALAGGTIGIGVFLWNSHQVVVTDHAHYITSGINLLNGKGFTNHVGAPETWFPPVYPLLIAVAHLFVGDGMQAAKLVSLAASVAWIVAVHRVGCAVGGPAVGAVTALMLLLQPDRALFSVLSMSQATFSALLWSAVAVYVADLEDRKRATAPTVSALLALAALTRPEGLLPAGLFVVDRAVRLWPSSPRRAVHRAALMAGVVALILLPYSVYLYRTTGKVALTGKSDINFAVGRAEATGEPLYRINPETLELDLNHGKGGVRDLVRYARNLRAEVRLLAGQLDHVWVFWAGLGVWLLLLARSPSAVVVGWAGAPLAVMPLYLMAPPFVVPYLAVFMLPAAVGAVRVARACMGREWPATPRLAGAVLVCATAVWALAGSVQDLQSFRDPGREAVAERMAGEWLARSPSVEGPVIAVGATVAYYSGRIHRYMTRDDLSLVRAHMRARRIPYLAVSDRDGDHLHASVRALLSRGEADGLRLLHTAVDPAGAVCRVFTLDSAGH